MQKATIKLGIVDLLGSRTNPESNGHTIQINLQIKIKIDNLKYQFKLSIFLNIPVIFEKKYSIAIQYMIILKNIENKKKSLNISSGIMLVLFIKEKNVDNNMTITPDITKNIIAITLLDIILSLQNIFTKNKNTINLII